MEKLFATTTILVILLITATVPIKGEEEEEGAIDVCSITNPIYSAYCTCDPDDQKEVETLKCNFWGTPTHGEELWSAISKLKNVSFLEISTRPARSLTLLPSPSMFASLSHLTYLSLKYSHIQNIACHAFGNSSSLSEVMLKDNMIQGLERGSFSNLKNASRINLSDNLLTEINRHVFTQLPKLQGLYLDRNRIQVVHDKAFHELENLEELDLKQNNLSVIAREVFSGLRKLTRLELQDNSIEYLGDHVFADMPHLYELDLHNNHIRSISSSAFYNLKALGRLNLKGNKIVVMEAPLFSPIGMLYSLDVRDNELETVSEALMQPILENLKNGSFQLMMEGNRFTCSCKLLWVQKLYTETESGYVKAELERLQCNMFHTATLMGKHQRHYYTADITLESAIPEETTTDGGFDGIKHVIKLNPAEFKCHEQQQQHPLHSKDLASVPQSDGGNVRSASDESHEGGGRIRTYPTVSENKKDLQQSHHQSHVDTGDNSLSSRASGNVVNFASSSSLLFAVTIIFSFFGVSLN